jgi:sulfoacetaldehyde dehydrogenase
MAIQDLSDSPEQTSVSLVDDVVATARRAQARYEKGADQARYDRAALAAAWTLMEPARNRELAQFAVATTGLGNVEDKINKNHRKTLGLLRDIAAVKTCGVIGEIPQKGITEIARPIGVIGSVVPSTNPLATPVNNIVNALKCGNAIVLSPSPSGVAACERLLACMHAEFEKSGTDPDLVQMVPPPAGKDKTQRLMELADLVIVTGSQDNVRRAYSSGTPAIGVGAGNATVIVDETADLNDAAQKIAASKSFDNATSCSSENALVVVDEIYESFVQALDRAGGRLLDEADAVRLHEALFQGSKLNRAMIAKDIDVVLDVAGIAVAYPEAARFLVLPAAEIGPGHPESGEKLSLVVALYRARDFDHAKELAAGILGYQGAGHSVGLHSTRDDRAKQLGLELPTCRVIVNQAHCFATGGSFDNGAPFSLSMGCGSWGGNSIDGNLNYRHFMNVTNIIRTIAPDEPALEEIFGGYWREAGR